MYEPWHEPWRPGQCAIVIDRTVEGLMNIHGQSAVEEMAVAAVINADLAMLRMMIVKKGEMDAS